MSTGTELETLQLLLTTPYWWGVGIALLITVPWFVYAWQLRLWRGFRR